MKTNRNQTTQPTAPERKPYEPPRIVYSGKLEAQAGSPLGDTLFDVLDNKDTGGF